jgi:hypothetical protein
MRRVFDIQEVAFMLSQVVGLFDSHEQGIILPLVGSTEPQLLVNFPSFCKNIFIAIPIHARPTSRIANSMIFKNIIILRDF